MTVNTLKGQALYSRAQQVIPGGAHLFGKRAELYAPDLWPSYFDSASGCRVTDIDGNTYLDFTMVGIGANVLGYSDPDIIAAVTKAHEKGNLTTLNCPEEVLLAEKLVELHPGATKARFCRSGGEIASLSIRAARAAVGKSSVAFCGYHGWHDWYLSSNIERASNLDDHLMGGLPIDGLPRQLSGLSVPFDYNDLGSLARVLEQNSDIGTIILEPFRANGPHENFLVGVRDLADKHQCILIFDEITSGFREYCGGTHVLHGVVPDAVLLGKTMSNGTPMSALVGNERVMDGLSKTFVSSTYWTDRSGPSAALAFIKKFEALDVGAKLKEKGLLIRKGLMTAAENAGLDFYIEGMPQLLQFKILHSRWNELSTYLVQEMLKRGFLASDRVYANYAHSDDDIGEYLTNMTEIFNEIALAIRKDKPLTLQTRLRNATFRKIS